MGAGDVGAVNARANEQRAIWLRASVERACESIGSAMLSHPSNDALRARLECGALDAEAFFAKVWQLVATMALFEFAAARSRSWALDREPESTSRWSALLERIRAAHRHPVRSVLAVIDRVFVTPTLLDELATMAVSDEAMIVVRDALKFEKKRGPERNWRSIDSTELLSTLDAARVQTPTVLREPWALRLAASADVSSGNLACERAASDAVGAVIEGVIERDDLFGTLAIVDPRCGCGTMLASVVRALVARVRFDASPSVDPTLSAGSVAASIIGWSIRGTDTDPVRVSLSRLALWLEAPELLDATTLRRCVSLRSEGDRLARASFVDGVNSRRWLIVSDAGSRFDAALSDALALTREGDWLVTLAHASVAWATRAADARATATENFALDQPLLALRTANGHRLLVIAQRRSGVSQPAASRWLTAFEGEDEATLSLLAHLQRFSQVELAITPMARAPLTLPTSSRRAAFWRRDGALLGAVVWEETDEEAVCVPDSGCLLTNNALVAWCGSTPIQWQFRTLSRLRGTSKMPLDRDELYELAAPLALPARAWESLYSFGTAACNRGFTREILDDIDDIVMDLLSLDGEQRQLLRSWRADVAGDSSRRSSSASRDEAPRDPARITAPSEDRGESSPRTVASSQRGPASPSAPSGSRADGRGAETVLRTRSDDGRAASLTTKRRTTMPEDEAELEAYSIACAAGADGILLDELVRRGREHTEDELRVALVALAESGWVSISDDERPRVLSVRAAIAKRAR